MQYLRGVWKIDINNNTGNWYAKDYSEFVHQCFANFKEQKVLYADKQLRFTIKPLNILKQIISMFICVNGDLLTGEKQQFKHFILDRYNQIFPLGYRVFIYTTDSNKCRYSGLSVIRQETGKIITCSEIVHRLFGFQLIVNSNPTSEMAETTEFSMFKYNEEQALLLRTSMLDVIVPLPGNGWSK